MRSVLIPVDASTADASAIRATIAGVRDGSVETIHLVNVQAPLTGYSTQFINGLVVRDFLRERGQQALAEARRRLDAAGVRYTAHVLVGDPASTIGEMARELRVHEILMGLDGGGWLRSLMLWLTVNRVRRYATVPVMVLMAPPRVPAPLVGSFGATPTR